MPIIKKSLLHTFYYANGKITCIRCNLSGKFVSIKKYLAKQKANVILSNANNKQSNGCNDYITIAIMFIFVIVAYMLAFNMIVKRQEQYNNVNNSHELMTNYYTNCNTDSECEQLEAQLKFDFKKGMN